MSRLNRNTPLPEDTGARVDDPKTQRALDGLRTTLRALVQFIQPFVQPEKWKPLQMYENTVDFSSSYQVGQYKKDPLGRVWVRGELADSGPHPAGHTLALLPIGYRPPAKLSIVVGDGSGSSSGLVEVLPTGEINHIAGSTAQISMNFSFDTSEA